MKNKKMLFVGALLPMMLGSVSCGQSHANVGLLYCSSEANSVYQIEVVKAALEAKNLSTKLISFSDAADIQSVLSGTIDSVDTLYIPTDNACASSSSIIGQIVRAKNKPVFAGEKGICEGCGDITLSISYYSLGVQTGRMAIDVLLGKRDIKEMEIAKDPNPIKMYNSTLCEALGLTVSSDYIEVNTSIPEVANVQFENSENKQFKIGINQFVTHDALDAATRGFKDAVKLGLGTSNVKFVEQNAAGDPSICATISNSLVSQNCDLIMANATPSLQSAANATQTIPVLGTSVTDYGAALNIKDFDGVVGTNVSGTSDLAPLAEQANMLSEVFARFMQK